MMWDPDGHPHGTKLSHSPLYKQTTYKLKPAPVERNNATGIPRPNTPEIGKKFK